MGRLIDNPILKGTRRSTCARNMGNPARRAKHEEIPRDRGYSRLEFDARKREEGETHPSSNQ